MRSSWLSLVFSLLIFTYVEGQDTNEPTKKKWMPSIKMPFKVKSSDDTTKRTSKLAFWKRSNTDTTDSKFKLSRIFGRSKKEIETLPLHESVTLGIGTIMDSTTNITESYEVLRFFQENYLVLDGKKVPVRLISHPSQTELSVTGTIQHHYAKQCADSAITSRCHAYETRCRFQVWKNGIPVDEVTDYQLTFPTTGQLKTIKEELSFDFPLYDGTFRVIRYGLEKLYRSLYHYTGQDETKLVREEQVEDAMDCSSLNEFLYSFAKRNKLEKRDLSDLLPGHVTNYIPFFDTASTVFIKKEVFDFPSDKEFRGIGISIDDPVDIANSVNAIYRYVDKNEFRNINSKFIPEKFKLELSPIIAPKSSWVGASIAYWIAGNKFLEKGDWAAAEMTYEACLFLSGESNTSQQVKHELRMLAAKGLLEVARKQGRKVSMQYLELVISLLQDYLRSLSAIEAEKTYRDNVKKFQDVCVRIDDKIDDMRASNIGSKIISVVEVVWDGLVQDGSSQKAVTRFTESGETLNKGRKTMFDELTKVAMKRKLEKTKTDNSVKEIEYGSVYLSKIVWEILNSHDFNKNTFMYLKQFAIDKPITLQKVKLLETATAANQTEGLKDLARKLIEIEKDVIYYEKRELQIGNKY